jgi:hypothetical protein
MDLQVMLNIAAKDSHRERYKFSQSKTKIMTVNSKGISGPTVDTGRWVLEGSPVEVVSKQEHLGISRQSVLTCTTPLVMDRIQLGRRSTYAFMGAGMHGLNGLHPMATHRLWSTYVLPRVVHSLEALVLSDSDLANLELYQRSTLRRIQHLHKSTANSAVYLLLGACPLTGIIHRNILVFMGNILLQPDSTEWGLLQRQLAMKDLESASWASHV